MENTGEQLDGQVLYERQKSRRAGDIVPFAPTIICAHLRHVENMGSIMRVADAVGSPKVLFIDDEGQFNPRRIRKLSRDSHRYIEWALISQAEFIETHLPQLPPIIAVELTEKAENIYTTDLPEQCAFMVGDERKGISEELLSLCERAVYLPMFGINGSMNVATSAGIALYEWRRRYGGETVK